MLTESMRRSGWRELTHEQCLRLDDNQYICRASSDRSSCLLNLWESKGGRWAYTDDGTVKILSKGGFILARQSDGTNRLWRPVHPSTWDYAPEGWHDNFPKDPDVMWWRKDRGNPVHIWLDKNIDKTMILFWGVLRDSGYMSAVVDDGQWIAPCVKPEVMP